jgi:diguanylate cyclase (GGDEF)-like protein
MGLVMNLIKNKNYGSTIKRYVNSVISHPLIAFTTLTFMTGVLVFAGLPVTVYTIGAFIFITSANAYLINHRIIMQFNASHDSLTYLPNRAEFYHTLQKLVDDDNAESIHVFMMDLDKFKRVNDTLGHQVGDLLLKKATNRITRVLRTGDIVARLGGDEFAVILSPTTSIEGATIAAGRIVEAFKEPFELEGVQTEVGISIGVASYPSHGTTTTELIKYADIAMYVAKNDQMGYFVYTKNKDVHCKENLSLPFDLKNAINRDEFQILFQPKIDISTGKAIGAEVLLRWHHPQYGLIMPDKFIAIAESTGYINTITEWLLERVIVQQQIWESRGLNLRIAINVSANNLSDRHTLSHLTQTILQSNINPNNLIFEMTETAILTDPDTAIKHLIVLNSLGVKLSIDDFGTGHSSFTYLKHLPIYEIKIDKSFVMDINGNSQDFNIVKSSINVAHDIGCIAVAEGVEDIDTLTTLMDLGCDVAQGYYFAKPLPVTEFEQWIKNYNRKIDG